MSKKAAWTGDFSGVGGAWFEVKDDGSACLTVGETTWQAHSFPPDQDGVYRARGLASAIQDWIASVERANRVRASGV